MTLIILLIVAAAFAALLGLSNYEVVKFGANDQKTHEKILAWISVDAIAYLCFGVCFNVAHWLFAFEYFVIAQIMPLVIKRCVVPLSTQKYYTRLKQVILVLNILTPIAGAIFLFLDNYFYYTKKHPNKPYAWAYTYSMTINVTLQVLSGMFILYAVYKIGRTIRKRGLKTKEVNQWNLALHATAFTLYMLALIVDLIYFFNYMYQGAHHTQHAKEAFKSFVIVLLVSNVFNYLGQLLLIKIFY